MDRERLKHALLRHEGLRLKPYRCPAGRLTIGVGRNLDDNGISREEALILLDEDVARAEAGLDAALPWWREQDDVRQEVLANMAFNLGTDGLMKFRAMLAALRRGDFEAASAQMLDSAWALQVGARARELAAAMKGGTPC